MTKPPIAATILPRADLTDACEDAYAAYAASYPNLKAMP